MSTRIYQVRTRDELAQAVTAGGLSDTRPKIIYIEGTIDANTDANGRRLGAADYADPAFDQAAFLAAYDPSGAWGRRTPTGPLEDARARSHANQSARVVFRVGSNTTILGVGTDAKLVGGSLLIQSVDNVIVRNITFENAYDFFPAWDPNDGSAGEWNSQLDNITIRNATRVWIDQCSFSDGSALDRDAETRFGRKVQHHDGLVDITQGADRVTISYSSFTAHDKVMLIGASDTDLGDDGRLRVTLHHNLFENVTQRNPNVRFGRVHVFNNLYRTARASAVYPHFYHLGIGVSSRIYSEANAFESPDIAVDDLVRGYGGSVFFDQGSTLNGMAIDLVAAAARAAGATLWQGSNVGWSPAQAYAYALTDVADVAAVVLARAGAGR